MPKTITVRAHRLTSGPGYSNRAIDLEAVMADGETIEATYRELDLRCLALLEGRALDTMRDELAALTMRLPALVRRKDELEAEIEELERKARRLRQETAAPLVLTEPPADEAPSRVVEPRHWPADEVPF